MSSHAGSAFASVASQMDVDDPAADTDAASDDFPICIEPLNGDDEQPFNADERLFAEYMESFFTRNMLRDRVAPYVNGERPLSKRDMTWAATNYFPQNPVYVRHPYTGFSVRLDEEYAVFQEEYRKHRFDSFRRTYDEYSRCVMVVCRQDPSFSLKTTFAQLMFFRFAIPYHFIEECEKHLSAIKEHWAQADKKRKKQRAAEKAITGKKAKRAALTLRPEHHMRMVRGKVVIEY